MASPVPHTHKGADIPSLVTLPLQALRTAVAASLRLSRQIHDLPPMRWLTHATLAQPMPAVADLRTGKIVA